MPTTAEKAAARDQKVLEYLQANGPKSQAELGRECGIPTGSILNVMGRLVDGKAVTRQKSGTTVTYTAVSGGLRPGEGPRDPVASTGARTPSRAPRSLSTSPSPPPAAAAPVSSPAEPQNGALPAVDVSGGVTGALLEKLLREGRDWSAQKTHAFVEWIRQGAELLDSSD